MPRPRAPSRGSRARMCPTSERLRTLVALLSSCGCSRPTAKTSPHLERVLPRLPRPMQIGLYAVRWRVPYGPWPPRMRPTRSRSPRRAACRRSSGCSSWVTLMCTGTWRAHSGPSPPMMTSGRPSLTRAASPRSSSFSGHPLMDTHPRMPSPKERTRFRQSWHRC